jgi:hypothetical protein
MNADNLAESHGACSKIGQCGKCCVACSIGALVGAAIVPIIIFVIAPRAAQHILDTTAVSLNSTLSACDTLESWIAHGGDTLVQNSIALNLPGPLSSTVHSYKQRLYTTTCGTGMDMQGGYACENPNVTYLGSYTAPEMHLSNGRNLVSFSGRMHIPEPTTMLMAFVIPLFVPLHSNKARMILEAEDVTVTALGLKIGGLKMRSVLTCTGQLVLAPRDIPNSACYPNKPDHEPHTANGFYMSCEFGALSLTPPTTTTNANAIVVV